MKDRLIVALDVDSLKKAKTLVDTLYPTVKIFKIGNQLFTKEGPKAIEMVHKRGAKVFLDLKFHDIPNTVTRSVESVISMGVFMTNIHASGGKEMMLAARKAKKGKKTPMLLGVTVLTSMDKKALKQVGINASPKNQVKRLALLAKSVKLDGVVSSAQEISLIRKACGKKFIIATPGIRKNKAENFDQKRVQTPEYAFTEGADYIVVGRPITQAENPLRAAKDFLN